jgi:predicted nucleic acid-binding protein
METNNSTIIVDSSGLISLAIESDSNHKKAKDFAQLFIAQKIVAFIPCEVFAETLNILGKKFGHEQAAEAIEALLESSAFLVVPTSDIERRDAVAFFRTMPGGVSYTDSLVMAVADQNNTRSVFGFDDIFSKRGYQLPSLS